MEPRPRPRWWVRVLRTAGLSAGIVCVLLLVISMFFGDSLIFLPGGPWEDAALKQAPFPVEEVSFTAADGAKLVSWHLTVEKPRCTIIYFHGNAGNLTHRIDPLLSLGRLRANVLLVGYHGYGKSEGTPSEKGVYLDAEAAYRYVTEVRGVPSSRIVLFGESLGGGPAVELATRRPVAGIVIQSSFTSIRDMAGSALPFFPAHWFLKSKIDNLSKIGSVPAPKLFIATRRDEVVPCEQTRRLYEASAGPRTWVEFDDCGHNELYWSHRREWAAAVDRFLSEAVPN